MFDLITDFLGQIRFFFHIFIYFFVVAWKMLCGEVHCKPVCLFGFFILALIGPKVKIDNASKCDWTQLINFGLHFFLFLSLINHLICLRLIWHSHTPTSNQFRFNRKSALFQHIPSTTVFKANYCEQKAEKNSSHRSSRT